MKYLSEIGARHRFRDPLFGYVWLTDQECKIVDTPLFQRLRRIHQLALTKYVYPTAEHSRFVHSLGVLHCATVIFTGLFEHQLTELSVAHVIRMLKLLRFAALLHDIGHLPFSHATENALLESVNHEDVSQYIIRHYQPIVDILEEDAPIVASILSSKVKKKYKILHEIISGNLDADRADYLLRDSYYCGVKYGEYDFVRYAQAFGAREIDNYLRLIVNERDIFVVESFLVARYHYTLQVPYHRTRVGYDIALDVYLKEQKQKGELKELNNFIDIDDSGAITRLDFDFFEDFDDYFIFEMIKRDYRKNNNIWAKILLRQDHMRCLFDELASKEEYIKDFKYNVALLRKSDLEENKDFFVATPKVVLFKESSENNTDCEEKRSTKESVLVQKINGETLNITDYSGLIKTVSAEARPLRIYSTPDKKQIVENIINQN